MATKAAANRHLSESVFKRFKKKGGSCWAKAFNRRRDGDDAKTLSQDDRDPTALSPFLHFCFHHRTSPNAARHHKRNYLVDVHQHLRPHSILLGCQQARQLRSKMTIWLVISQHVLVLQYNSTNYWSKRRRSA